MALYLTIDEILSNDVISGYTGFRAKCQSVYFFKKRDVLF